MDFPDFSRHQITLESSSTRGVYEVQTIHRRIRYLLPDTNLEQARDIDENTTALSLLSSGDNMLYLAKAKWCDRTELKGN